MTEDRYCSEEAVADEDCGHRNPDQGFDSRLGLRHRRSLSDGDPTGDSRAATRSVNFSTYPLSLNRPDFWHYLFV
jgi:hypothetical protein